MKHQLISFMIISQTQGHFLFPVIRKWLCRQVLSTQFWHLITKSTSITYVKWNVRVSDSYINNHDYACDPFECRMHILRFWCRAAEFITRNDRLVYIDPFSTFKANSDDRLISIICIHLCMQITRNFVKLKWMFSTVSNFIRRDKVSLEMKLGNCWQRSSWCTLYIAWLSIVRRFRYTEHWHDHTRTEIGHDISTTWFINVPIILYNILIYVLYNCKNLV